MMQHLPQHVFVGKRLRGDPSHRRLIRPEQIRYMFVATAVWRHYVDLDFLRPFVPAEFRSKDLRDNAVYVRTVDDLLVLVGIRALDRVVELLPAGDFVEVAERWLVVRLDQVQGFDSDSVYVRVGPQPGAVEQLAGSVLGMRKFRSVVHRLVGLDPLLRADEPLEVTRARLNALIELFERLIEERAQRREPASEPQRIEEETPRGVPQEGADSDRYEPEDAAADPPSDTKLTRGSGPDARDPASNRLLPPQETS